MEKENFEEYCFVMVNILFEGFNGINLFGKERIVYDEDNLLVIVVIWFKD